MPDAEDSNHNDVAAVITDDQNKLWIFTSHNIFNFDFSHKKIVFVANVINFKKTGIITAAYNSKNKTFWLAIYNNGNQLAYFDPVLKKLSYTKQNIDQILGHENPLSLFKIDKDYNLWLANYIGDLCKYDVANNTYEHYSILHDNYQQKKPLPNSTVFTCIDDGNDIWFCGDNNLGILDYNKTTNNFSKLQNDNGSEFGLHYNETVFNLFQDKEKNIWAGSDLGMNIFNPSAQKFNYLIADNKNGSHHFYADVTCIYQSHNKHVWLTTWGQGVFEYDSNLVQLKHYVHNDQDQFSLGDSLNRTWCITEDSKGRMWIGSQYGMLFILNPSTEKFINKNVAAFNNKTIMHLLSDGNNNIWFGLYDGALAKWNTTNDSLVVYRKLYNNSTSDLSIIEGLCSDNKNNIWFTTGSGGINHFNQQTKSVDENGAAEQHSFLPIFLNDSIIAGGTEGKGLFTYNIRTKQTKFYTTKDGLSSDIVYGGLLGDKNDVWIIASNGLEHLNLSNNKIILYDANDGIYDHIFLRAFCKLKNNKMLVAANSGVIYFDPSDINTKLSPPDVTITNFAVNQHNLSVDSLAQSKTITLSHNQNVISIEFASLSFAGRKTNSYSYQLTNADKSWINAGNQQSVTYANLSPGHYIFQVKATNIEGTQTKNITSLNITINPPWWQTWWAYLIWICCAAYLFFVVYDYRKKNRLALSHIRQKIATDLHDDIGSTLNSISVYSEIAGHQIQSNPANAKDILGKMGDASRSMIDVMNDIVWAVNPKNDQFENVLQRMQYFAGELLSGKNILLQFDVDEKAKAIKLTMEKRKNFYLIFKEAIHNAFKYSNAEKVIVKIALVNNYLLMQIEDNGDGFSTVQNSLGGNGLKNMQQRAAEINAWLNIDSVVEKGTSIKLKIPLR